jgi:hypothetical protein
MAEKNATDLNTKWIHGVFNSAKSTFHTATSRYQAGKSKYSAEKIACSFLRLKYLWLGGALRQLYGAPAQPPGVHIWTTTTPEIPPP